MIRVSKWTFSLFALCFALSMGLSSRASADGVCGVNAVGNTSFPGLDIGTVTSTCVIGAAPNTSGITDNANVGPSDPTSIYKFYFGGGSLSVTELLGNQGFSDDVFLELDSLASSTSTTATVLESTQVPHQSAAGATATVSDSNLAAGYYAINTYFAPSGTDDPQLEITITGTPSVPAPEPGSGLLLGMGLVGFGLLFTGRKAFSV